jgi:hypothetical protein
MVDRTKPSKLRVFTEGELRDCQDYFVEIQSDSTLPPNEIMTAAERLTLIRSEIATRHSDAKHQQTQRLARWAIAAGMASVAVAIVFGVTQCLANRPTRENLPAAIETPTIASPEAIESPTVATPTPTAPSAPAEKAASPSPAAPTASPKAKPTPKKAKAKRNTRRTARVMPAGRTTDEAANPPAPGGGHGQVWVNTEKGVYHREGSRFYGTTRRGKYTTEQDAIQAGYKAAPKGP